MSLRSFFNRLAEKRDAKRKYKALAASIKAGSLDGVKRALAAGANAGYFPGKTEEMPLSLAVQKGDAEIFETLLKTDGGASAVACRYGSRVLTIDPYTEDTTYFLPSLLYTAIEMKREEIALALVRSPLVAVESPGEFISNNRAKPPTEAQRSVVKNPLDFAREQGLTRVAEAITEKLKPVRQNTPQPKV